MKIALDIDDTLTNTREKQIILWKEYIKKHPTKEYTEELPKEINAFDNEYISMFWDENREILSFETTFKEKADIITNQLHKDGHKICIVTSRPEYKYKDLTNRLKNWFKENNIYVDEIYTSIKDKGNFCKENNFDLIIDDSINHITKANELNIKTILFNNNNDYKGNQTNNWLELYKIIKELDK